MTKKNKIEPVTIVLPTRNAATTVLLSLQSIHKQTYPIKEVIVVDNASSDDSIKIVRNFAKKSRIPIRIVSRQKNYGLGASFNFGVESSKTSLVILMHSDCILPTAGELDKLTRPLIENNDIIATYPTLFLPESVWQTYSFWEKCFFSRKVGKGAAGLLTKFDCIRKKAYQDVGEIDVKNFGFGGFDADMHDKLRKIGFVAKSEAVVMHLHYLGEGFSLGKLLAKLRMDSRTNGRCIRMRGLSLIHDGLFLLIRPSLAILPFIPYLHTIGIVMLIIYSFLYTHKVFITRSTFQDPRIILLPLLNVFLLYYETFWTIEAFLFGKNKIE
ncbi:MAG: glycosyltransferase family 2 protein [Candidatus Levyibacteriota bacterium]|nr:MAG: glycosyltransferase family 2 protein [Candidatus Levybacteria bacterium]